MTALPDGTVIGWMPIVDNPNIFTRFMPIPEVSGSIQPPSAAAKGASRWGRGGYEVRNTRSQWSTSELLKRPSSADAQEHGVAVVVLSDEHVLMSSDAPQTTELLRRMGYKVTTVGISEFEALEGCVTCLSVRVR